MKPEIKTVAVEQVLEVQVYLDACARLEEFKHQHAKVFDEYAILVEEHNMSLQQAEKVIRARGVKCGPFDLYQYKTTISAEKLYDAVGPSNFAKFGGTTGTKTTYALDKKLFEACVAQNLVPPDAVSAVVEISPTYHVPKPVSL